MNALIPIYHADGSLYLRVRTMGGDTSSVGLVAHAEPPSTPSVQEDDARRVDNTRHGAKPLAERA